MRFIRIKGIIGANITIIAGNNGNIGAIITNIANNAGNIGDNSSTNTSIDGGDNSTNNANIHMNISIIGGDIGIIGAGISILSLNRQPILAMCIMDSESNINISVEGNDQENYNIKG